MKITSDATLTIEFYVNCPNCDYYFDLFKEDNNDCEAYELMNQIIGSDGFLSDEIDKVDFTIECPECEEEFKVQGGNW